MTFLRFYVSRRHPDSGVEDGLFGVAYALCNDDGVSIEHRQLLKEHLAWFEKHLPKPVRFNRSTSKGFYRRAAKGIAWYRDTASEHIARMHTVRQLVEDYGYSVGIVREERVGYIVYEDEVQVVAEPFASTRTRA